MIRDPSDGSVRDIETLKRQQQEMQENCPPTPGNSTPAKYTSGLQTSSEKPENIARLEESRKWIRDYHAGKIKQTDGDSE